MRWCFGGNDCACNGKLACSTCQVIVEPGHWYEQVGEPCDAELDMLELAYNPQPTSRLGCQIVLSENLDGMIVEIPQGVHNLFDHIPFED